MASTIEVRVPDIGDFEDVDVVEVLVAPGDRVEVEDSLVTLESDKASMEIPAPQRGVVEALKVSVGDKVSEGSLLLTLSVEAADSVGGEDERPVVPAQRPGASPPRAPAPVATQTEAPPPSDALPPPPARPPVSEPVAPPSAIAHASPLVRKFARELGVDLSGTSGTGPGGRILEEDVKSRVRGAMDAVPAAAAATVPAPPVDFARFGRVEVQALSRMRRASGRNLSRSWQTVPHVTQHDEADVTELESFRRAQVEGRAEGAPKLTLLPFLMKAVASALRDFPAFRSSLDPSGENLIVKHYFHLGVAVDTDQGLVVPVVRDVDRKRLLELSAEVAELADRARAGKLAPQDIQGACFSISSLGGIGGTNFTPIVNAPEVAVLGVSRMATRPVWEAGEAGAEGRFVPRRVLPFSLSYDHRVIDGAEAVRFTSHLAQTLSHIENLLL